MEEQLYNKRSLIIEILSIVILVVILVSSVVWWQGRQQRPQKYVGQVEKVRIGMQLLSSSALIMIAQDRGYFADEGLDAEIKDYVSGKIALQDGLIGGKEDIVSTAEVPIVFNSFSRSDLRIISTIATSNSSQKIIARRDRGITTPKDLRNKIVATQEASSVHFFLHLFLVRNLLSEKDITLVFMKPEDLSKALVDGKIDAFAMREPFISQAQNLLQGNGIVFSEEDIYIATDNIVASEDFVKSKPQVVQKILRALSRAEKFAALNPQFTKELARKRIGASKSEMEGIWRGLNLGLSLRQLLLFTMEDEARWAIKNELVDSKEVPNYLNYIYFDGLEKVKPEVVSMVH